MSWGTNTPLLTLDIPQCVDVMWMCYRYHLEYHLPAITYWRNLWLLQGPAQLPFGLPCGLRCVVLGLDATRPGRGSRRLRRHDAGLANATSSVTHFTQAVVEKLGIKYTLSKQVVTVDIRDFPAKCLNFENLAWYEQLLIASMFWRMYESYEYIYIYFFIQIWYMLLGVSVQDREADSWT